VTLVTEQAKSGGFALPSLTNGQLMKRLLALGWRYRWGCLRVLLIQIVALAIGLSGLSLAGLGVDVIRHAVDPTARVPRWPLGLRPPQGWSDFAVVTLIAGMVIGLSALRGTLTYIYTVSVNKLIQGQLVVHLRSAVYDKLQRLSFRFFDSHQTGSIINRVTGDSQNARMFIDGVVLQSIILLLTLGVYLTYMVNIHAELTLVVLAPAPLLFVAAAVFSRKVRRGYDRNRELYDQMILTLSESVSGIHVVKGFARVPHEIAKFGKANDNVTNQQRSVFFKVSIFTPFVMFLTYLSMLLLLAYGGYLVIHDELPLGTGLLVFAGLLTAFSAQVNNVATIANSMQQSLTGARRVFEILEAPVEIRSPPDAIRLPRARGEVRFEHVTFGYDPAEPCLVDIDCVAKPGMCVAILGETGCGKTTLLSLIPRFYDPVKGRVLVDGHDLRRLNLDDLRRNIGVVFQESFLFSNTVAANIAFGHPDATREQIEKAARIAAAHEFILDLPNGYDTILGEGGNTLSGGQRQRLALARAILLDPAILLLDDPTAAIDAQTEEEILAALDSAMEGRTTFIVANRLSTLRRADIVIVLSKDGRIAQMGTHEELMQREGHYRKTAHIQMSEALTPLAAERGQA
jgi:ATP-binding cassette subfamily B protein